MAGSSVRGDGRGGNGPRRGLGARPAAGRRRPPAARHPVMPAPPARPGPTAAGCAAVRRVVAGAGRVGAVRRSHSARFASWVWRWAASCPSRSCVITGASSPRSRRLPRSPPCGGRRAGTSGRSTDPRLSVVLSVVATDAWGAGRNARFWEVVHAGRHTTYEIWTRVRKEPPMTMTDTPRLDEAALEQFVHQAVGDLAAAICGLMVHLGDRLGLYRAMAGAGPLTPVSARRRAPAPRSATCRSGWPTRPPAATSPTTPPTAPSS